jgi:hypothetical protein
MEVFISLGEHHDITSKHLVHKSIGKFLVLYPQETVRHLIRCRICHRNNEIVPLMRHQHNTVVSLSVQNGVISRWSAIILAADPIH